MALIVCQILLGFDDLGTCEEYWSGILWSASQLDLSDVSLMIRLGVWFGRGRPHGEVLFSSHHIEVTR